MAKLISEKNKVIKHILNKLVLPRSKDRDGWIKEYVLNVLLVSSIFMSVVAFLLATVSYCVATRNNHLYVGLSGEKMFFCIIFFLVLYLFSKKKGNKFVAPIFVLFFFLSATYTTYVWGINVPQAILINSLTIIMAGILVNTRFAFNIVFLIILSLLILLDLETKGIVKYNMLWALEAPKINDVIINSITFFVIAIISWLSNKEIENALKRARKSENDLRKEKNGLEIEVKKRTEELKKIQLEKITYLYKFADFGRLTAGLFHDISNPLTQVSLNLSNIKNQTKNKTIPDLKEINPVIKRAINGTKQMERLVVSVRNQIQEQETKSIYNPYVEIKTVMESMDYKAKKMNVKVNILGKRTIQTFGNSIRFYQLVSNLISNALDSYYEIKRIDKREINVNLDSFENEIVLKIEDFGCGIENKIIEKIFDPLFTTKDPERGTGVGLYISKNIVEKELMGKIEVKSKVNEGTLFVVKFPIKEKSNEQKY